MEERVSKEMRPYPKKAALTGAFFWLSALYFVYCARPEDWIPGLSFIPLAKLTGLLALLALIMSAGKAPGRIRNLPKDTYFLLALLALLFASALVSPVWRGGALSHTFDFSKAAVACVLTFVVINTLERLQRIIFIQSASVALIAALSLLKGRGASRLSGVLGGIYDNSNDLAFAIVLALPFCLAFLLRTPSILRKIAWALAMLIMAAALFRTESRGGFIELVAAGAACMWHFGIKGRRPLMIAVVVLIGVVLVVGAGGRLSQRFIAMSGDINSDLDQSAYASYEERRELTTRSLEGILHYPILGIGASNFITYSGRWREVHNSYLQICVEGGIPALILYLLFFRCSFDNLKRLRRQRNLDSDTILWRGALHSSMVGFVVGAFFAPEAYQLFPYFMVAQTSALLFIVMERESASKVAPVYAGRSGVQNSGHPGSEAPDAKLVVRRQTPGAREECRSSRLHPQPSVPASP